MATRTPVRALWTIEPGFHIDAPRVQTSPVVFNSPHSGDAYPASLIAASDLPMLSAVGHPVAVNPDSKLERHAREQGWPIVIFSQQTKSVIRRTSSPVAPIT